MTNVNQICKSIMIDAGRGMYILKILKKFMKKNRWSLNEMKYNVFYKEHISGSGFMGKSNQTGSCFDFGVIRGITDKLKFKATLGTPTILFSSFNALFQYKDFSFDGYLTCEHTISVKSLREMCINNYLKGNIKSTYDLAKFIVEHQIVSAISKNENSYKPKIESNLQKPFKKYNFDVFYIRKNKNSSYYNFDELYNSFFYRDIFEFEKEYLINGAILREQIRKMPRTTYLNEQNKLLKKFKNNVINKISDDIVIVNDFSYKEIKELYKEDLFLGPILKKLEEYNNQNDNFYFINLAEDFLTNKTKSYHQIAKKLSLYTLSEYMCAKKHYVHKIKSTNINS